MHTFQDPDSEIRIHHNGDYSGRAEITIPLQSPPDASSADLRFAVEDPDWDQLADLEWMRPDTYGIEFEFSQGKAYARITLPAKVLVRFAASAVHSAIISQLEQTDVESLLRDHL